MELESISNGVGSGSSVFSILPSLGRAPTPPLIQRGSEGNMKKQYKESEYSKKLRDPRWQKKRLEIMQRDDFHCQKCFDGEGTLNVHHCYYSYGNDPWEYPDISLVTLCETCHEEETICAKDIKADLIKILCQRGLLSPHLQDITEGFLHFRFNHPEYNASMIGWALGDEEMREIMEEKFSEYCRKIAAAITAKG